MNYEKRAIVASVDALSAIQDGKSILQKDSAHPGDPRPSVAAYSADE
jgi:hypothetical protein